MHEGAPPNMVLFVGAGVTQGVQPADRRPGVPFPRVPTEGRAWRTAAIAAGPAPSPLNLDSPPLPERTGTVSKPDFQQLVEEYYDRLFRSARYMCNDETEAEDLVQETFLAAADSLKRFKGRSSPYTWLYGIMLNKLRRHIRRKKRRPMPLYRIDDSERTRSAEDVLASDAPQPEETVELHETVEQVREVMDELPPDHRSVIALRFVEGLSYQEISETLECPLGTVKSRIHYALQKMAEKLKEHAPPS